MFPSSASFAILVCFEFSAFLAILQTFVFVFAICAFFPGHLEEIIEFPD